MNRAIAFISKVRENRTVIEFWTSVISLIGILAYTYWHTAGVLSQYTTAPVVGYIAAFGIEIAVFSLSFRIGNNDRNRGFYTFTLIGVLIVSMLANMVMGFEVKYRTTPTWTTIQRLDIIEWIVWTAMNGLMSLISFALSKIIGSQTTLIASPLDTFATALYSDGTTRPHAPNTAWVKSDGRVDSDSDTEVIVEGEEVGVSEPGGVQRDTEVIPAPVELSSTAPLLSPSASRLYDYLLQVREPVSPSIVMRDFNVSRASVRNWSIELEKQGLVTRNGKLEVMR